MSGISREAIRLILWSERIADAAAQPQTSSTAPRDLVMKVRELLAEAANLVHEAKEEVRNSREDD